MTDFILIANIISTVGIAFCFWAFIDMGVKANPKFGYVLYIIGCIILMITSVMFKNAPTFVLNLIWLIISIYGYKEKDIVIPPYMVTPANLGLPLICFVGFISVLSGYYVMGGYMTMALYCMSYFLYTGKHITKMHYYAWCLLGIVFVGPLMLTLQQYASLAYEVAGVVISVVVIFKEHKMATANREI